MLEVQDKLLVLLHQYSKHHMIGYGSRVSLDSHSKQTLLEVKSVRLNFLTR